MIVHALRGAGVEPGWLIGAHDRRRAAQRRLERGRVARGRGRRVRPLAARAGGRDRAAHQRRARPPHQLRLAAGAARGLQRTSSRARTTAVIWDRPELLALRDGPLVAYDVPEPELVPGGSRFRWHEHEVRLAVPGVHNALNAAGALELVRLAGRPGGGRDRGAGRLPGRGATLSAARPQRRGGARVRRLRPPPERDRSHAAGRAHARAPPPGGRLPTTPVLAHPGARRRARTGTGRRRRGRGARRLSGPRAGARTSPA